MNPQSNQDLGLNLPQPLPGGVAVMPLPPQQAVQAAASPAPQAPPIPAAAPPVLAVSQATPVLRPTVAVHPMPDTNSEGASGDATAGQQTNDAQASPLEAADNDVIEREWVVRAKQVVANTRHDPYKQVQELNKLKAEYMKKRYDKVIKLPD